MKRSYSHGLLVTTLAAVALVGCCTRQSTEWSESERRCLVREHWGLIYAGVGCATFVTAKDECFDPRERGPKAK